MPKIVLTIVAFAFLLCSLSAQGAQQSVKFREIILLLNDVDVGKGRLTVAEISSDVDGKFEAQRKTIAELDAGIQPALKESKGKPDLAKAVKEFYIAAKTYFSAAIPTTRAEQASAAQLAAQLEAKKAALQLELSLAEQ